MFINYILMYVINVLLFIFSSNDSEDSQVPSNRKKAQYGQTFKTSWMAKEQFKKWLKQRKMNTLLCAVYIIKRFPLNLLENNR